MFQSLAKSHQNDVGETLVKVCLYAFFFFFKSILIRPNPQETADLLTFTEKILNGKLHFCCSDGRDDLWQSTQH